MTGGFWPGDLIVIAASPCMGKTALALNIAEHVALAQGLPVAIFSTDMGADQISIRMAASIGRISLDHLRTGKLTEYEVPRLATAIADLSDARLHVSVSSSQSIDAMQTEASDFFRTSGCPGLIVIDYLQLLDGDSNSNSSNRNDEISKISRGLKLLAQELDCPVIALSQLNRSVESRGDKRPMMSDLRDSGAIEQDADTILFIYRDDYYAKEQSTEPGVAEIIVAKARNGETGTMRLGWQKEYTRFTNLTHS